MLCWTRSASSAGLEVALDERGRVAVRDVGLGLAVEAGGRFDGDAAGAGLAQEVGGDLGVDAGDFDGDFEPGAWSRLSWRDGAV